MLAIESHHKVQGSCVLYHFYTLFPWDGKLHRPGFSMLAVEQRKIIAPLRM